MASTSNKPPRRSANRAVRRAFQIGRIADPKATDRPQMLSENVAAATNSEPLEAAKSEAFDAAKKASEAHDTLLHQQGHTAEVTGRDALLAALKFVEQFKNGDNIDLNAVKSFLAEKVGATLKANPHGNIRNEWQPVAKALSHENAERSVVSKRAYVLAALIHEEVSSENLMEAFEQPQDVGSKKSRTGMEKYILIYKDMRKEEGTKPQKKTTNPFLHWNKEKLTASAKYFLEALNSNGLLKIRHLDAILADEAMEE